MTKSDNGRGGAAAVFEGRELPCPTCKAPRPIRVDRNGKPYLSCGTCGVQLFVRLPEGIERLEKMARAGNGRQGQVKTERKDPTVPRSRASSSQKLLRRNVG